MSDWYTFKLEYIDPPTKQQVRAMNRLVASDDDAPRFSDKPICARWRSPFFTASELLVEFDRLGVSCKLIMHRDCDDGCCCHRSGQEWQYSSQLARAKDVINVALSPEQRVALWAWLRTLGRDEAAKGVNGDQTVFCQKPDNEGK
jgi:hypothetical protein